jgi:hypothetical protein
MPKKILLIASLLFSIFGVLSIWLLILLFAFPNEISQSNFFFIYTHLEAIFLYWGWVSDLIGLIFGFIFFKSEFKKIAKINIILSVVGLLGYPVLFYLMWRMFGGI